MSDGTKQYLNEKGLLHREDGPAVVYPGPSLILGKKANEPLWYLNGKMITEHEWGRLTCFTGITDDGAERRHWKDGRLHREDGPALVHSGNRPDECWWCLNGKVMTEEEWGERTHFSGMTECGGKKIYWKAGKLHREDGPAVVYLDEVRSVFFYLQGQDIIPAEWGRQTHFSGQTEWHDGLKAYWKEGLLHREDGPAIEYPPGSIRAVGNPFPISAPLAGEPREGQYLLEGKRYSHEKWLLEKDLRRQRKIKVPRSPRQRLSPLAKD